MKTSFILSGIRKNFGLLLQPVSWLNNESKLIDNWTMILLIEPCCSCSVTNSRPTLCNLMNCSTPSSPEPYAGTIWYLFFISCLPLLVLSQEGNFYKIFEDSHRFSLGLLIHKSLSSEALMSSLWSVAFSPLNLTSSLPSMALYNIYRILQITFTDLMQLLCNWLWLDHQGYSICEDVRVKWEGCPNGQFIMNGCILGWLLIPW